MAINVNIRLNDGVKEKLEQIARDLGALGAGGAAVGQPSISRLLMMIASGELAVSRKEKAEMETDNPVLIGYRSDRARIDVYEDGDRYCWTVTDELGQEIERGDNCGSPEIAMDVALETDPSPDA